MKTSNTNRASKKRMATMQAEFALLGLELQEVSYPCKEAIFVVLNWLGAHHFTAWHDVMAFLTQAKGRQS